MRERNFFLASSPRHLFLFAGLALERSDARNVLFFVEHIPAAGVTAYLDLLAAWSASPFAECHRLEADYRPLLTARSGGPGKKALKRVFRQRNRERIEAAVQSSSPPTSVYVGCDDFYESQYLLHRARQMNSACRLIYVEDGISAYDYSYQNTHIRNLPKEWIRALRYFPWWRPCTLPGTSGWLEEGYVAFPELVMDKFKHIGLRELPRNCFLGDEIRQLAGLMADAFGVDSQALGDADLLVAVTNSKWGRLLPGYQDTMRGICESLLLAGKRVAVKPHPREKESDPLCLGEHPNLYRVPSQAMFEILILLADNPKLVVIGDASTSLVATRWLRPEAKVIALRHDPQGIDGRYMERTFRAIGIRIEDEPRHVPERYFAVAPEKSVI